MKFRFYFFKSYYFLKSTVGHSYLGKGPSQNGSMTEKEKNNLKEFDPIRIKLLRKIVQIKIAQLKISSDTLALNMNFIWSQQLMASTLLSIELLRQKKYFMRYNNSTWFIFGFFDSGRKRCWILIAPFSAFICW